MANSYLKPKLRGRSENFVSGLRHRATSDLRAPVERARFR